MPVQYDKKDIKLVAIDPHETLTFFKDEVKVQSYTNEMTWEFMQNGYVVLRNFIPKDIIKMTLDSWKTIERNERWYETFFYKENDIIQDSPKDSLFKSDGCYQFPPSVGLHAWMHDALDDVLDIKLCPTYAYTRKYDRGAYLKAHHDRPSCEISTTICLGYESDDGKPWKIWVDNSRNWVDWDGSNQELFDATQGIPSRKREAHCISLEVGDVLLYQGPNAVHYRDRFLGIHSYHMFLHFVNIAGSLQNMPHGTMQNKRGSDGRRAPVYCYDGYNDIYHSEEQDGDKVRPEFVKAMDSWNNRGLIDEFKPSDFVNNYTHLSLAKEKPRNK